MTAIPSLDTVGLQTSASIQIPFDSISAQLVTAESGVLSNRNEISSISGKLGELESVLMVRCEELEAALTHQRGETATTQGLLTDVLLQLETAKWQSEQAQSTHEKELEALTTHLDDQAMIVTELTSSRQALQETMDRVTEDSQQHQEVASRLEELNGELVREKDLQADELVAVRLRLSEQELLGARPPRHQSGPMADLMSQSCHPYLTREDGAATPPTFERDNFQVGSVVYVVFNDETRQFILLSASRSIFYFVHENCLEQLGLPSPAECVDKERELEIKRSD